MRLLAQVLKTSTVPKLVRTFCNVIRDEIKVETFSDIHINVPYTVNIKPLDVHKYQNCDRLQIELQDLPNARKTLRHLKDGNNIKIFATTESYDGDTVCNIFAPVKANLHIEAQGNISTGVFGGSKLILKSTKGSIFVEKYQGEKIELSTHIGDIILKGAVVAAQIKATISENGSIKTKRLQGLNAQLQTKQGNIQVDCAYCDKSNFQSDYGTLDLQNVHKSAHIVLKDGKLNLSGLDGDLEAELHNSEAEIQISRILNNSQIVMREKGDLKLLLSDECQNGTFFEIVSKSHNLDPSVRLIPSKNEDALYLTPAVDNYKEVKVECGGKVEVRSASWINMLKLRAKK
ncbi:uncharacterized protein LOC660757 [Tribolium castaneum]|uniref:DUF4097 domain-containing protein n=1 Tax=Tribolium castaneum TaxID=7070 RepID=D6X3F7_TRICA|nr:PREDICTED: uncharacterized protein LOC660757 [Tribolium castaneum]EEZ97410.1 hypothetical protein TcasGA2_TC011239 [Tribolium castaneum]|eukprot:XP_008198551.1 PREDICTED: uncharacterized protein LOC660757 [Tribolium castaneum]